MEIGQNEKVSSRDTNFKDYLSDNQNPRDYNLDSSPSKRGIQIVLLKFYRKRNENGNIRLYFRYCRGAYHCGACALGG